jgi:hypothetical protein
LWAAYGGFSALSYRLHAISPRWEVSASPPHAIFLVLTGFPQGVSRGEGKYGRTALVSGAGYPTTPGSPHLLIRIHTLAYPGTDTPSASAAGGRQGGGRRDTKAEPGAKVNLAPSAIGGWGKRGQKGLLGLFNADGFPGNDPGWPGWTPHSRKHTFAHKRVLIGTPGPGGLAAPRR